MTNMRHCLSLLLIVLCAPVALHATPCVPPPGHPNAILLGTFTSTLTVGTTLSSRQLGQSLDADICNAFWANCVWRTATSEVIYTIDPNSITFTGDCADDLLTHELFALLMQETVARGVALGYTACPVSCSSPVTTRVYTASCVQRTGSGSTTSFTPCGTGQSYREYSYCCVGGVPVVTPGAASIGVCASLCDATVVAGTGSSIN